MSPERSPFDLLRLWFSLSRPVDRRAYALAGFGLMALKFLTDTILIGAATGRWWTPIDYFSPLLSQRGVGGEGFEAVFFALVLWTLPFVWIGASMTTRRALDAGFSGATGLLFFVPVVNYVWMLTLCLLPSAAREIGFASPRAESALGGVVGAAWPAALLGVAVALLSIFATGSYGGVLFVGTPFAMGFTSAYRARQLGVTRTGGVIGAGQLSLLLAGGCFLLFALEGVLCLAMAAPLASLLALGGSLVGGSATLRPAASAAQALLIFASLPMLLGVEALRPRSPLREVVSAIEIDAPPRAVWPNVVGFSELPPPARWEFELGVAHPLRARIEGRGVGAVRYCEFSTGAFVEPITGWEESARLSFDVASQPEPMHEWSPYRRVHAPHLLDGFRSRRGEFRLIARPHGRTRLEGSTWYTLDMAPAPYWTLWADALVHAIHRRVLEHVKRSAEAGPDLSPARR